MAQPTIIFVAFWCCDLAAAASVPDAQADRDGIAPCTVLARAEQACMHVWRDAQGPGGASILVWSMLCVRRCSIWAWKAFGNPLNLPCWGSQEPAMHSQFYGFTLLVASGA